MTENARRPFGFGAWFDRFGLLCAIGSVVAALTLIREPGDIWIALVGLAGLMAIAVADDWDVRRTRDAHRRDGQPTCYAECDLAIEPPRRQEPGPQRPPGSEGPGAG